MSDPFEKSSDKNIFEQMRRERAAQELRGGVERAIEEAQKKGVFDNLPGKGKPLNLSKNRQAGENALAFDLLQNNDYTLPWIAARREMLELIEAFRASLLQAWQEYTAGRREAVDATTRQLIEERWQNDKALLAAELYEVNKQISALNLTIPVERLEVLKLDWRKELARAGAGD